MPSVECVDCGEPVGANANFCGNCGRTVHVTTPSTDSPACPRCGAELPPGAKFCGSCGSSTRRSPGLGSPEDEITIAFPFPVSLSPSVEEELEQLKALYDDVFRRDLAGHDHHQKFGSFDLTGGRRRYGGGRAEDGRLARLANRLEDKATGGTYGLSKSRYFVRESLLDIRSGAIDLFQQAYVVPPQLLKGSVLRTYPPSIKSNLIVALLPKRAPALLAATFNSGQFLSPPGVSASPVAAELNDKVIDLAYALWQHNFDFLEGARHTKVSYTRTFSGGVESCFAVPGSEAVLEPNFSPSLFHSPLLNPAKWEVTSHAADKLHHSAYPSDFTLGLLPMGGFTIVALQYPVPGVFGHKGILEDLLLNLEVVAELLERIDAILPETGDSDRTDDAVKDWAVYKSLSTGITDLVAPAKRQTGYKRALVVGQAELLPVLPLELAAQRILGDPERR